jgi:hypothetical protein
MRPNESCNTVTSVLGSEISVWMGEVLSVGGVLNDGGGMSVVRGHTVVVVLCESGWLFSASVLVKWDATRFETVGCLTFCHDLEKLTT